MLLASFGPVKIPLLFQLSLRFKQYEIGVGGECSIYDPPVSYWCAEHPQGGGRPGAERPAGVIYKSPNGPYEHGTLAPRGSRGPGKMDGKVRWEKCMAIWAVTSTLAI